MNAWSTIWKAIGIAMAFLSLIAAIGGTAVYILNRGIEIGELRVRNEVLTAQNEAISNAQKEIVNAFKNLQTLEDEIRREGDNRPAGPVITRQLARMRSAASN
jgi:hypothetical protein